jgi:hypothetical protein
MHHRPSSRILHGRIVNDPAMRHMASTHKLTRMRFLRKRDGSLSRSRASRSSRFFKREVVAIQLMFLFAFCLYHAFSCGQCSVGPCLLCISLPIYCMTYLFAGSFFLAHSRVSLLSFHAPSCCFYRYLALCVFCFASSCTY